MSTINTNLASLQAQISLQRNNQSLSTSLQRLSTGLKINTGADDPAGLIASQALQAQITGINSALSNSTRAGNVLQTAEGALNEVSSLLLQLQGLNNQSANTGALSSDEIAANQLQVDSILNSINRISNTTEFNGVQLLNGQLDYTTSGVNASNFASTQISSANLPDNGSVNVSVQVIASAQTAHLALAASGISATPATFTITGAIGSQSITLAGSAHNSAIVAAINQYKSTTGVSAALSGADLRVDSTGFGSKQFVQVKTTSGTFLNGSSTGVDAQVNINGNKASVNGLTASIDTADLAVSLNLTTAFGQQTKNSSSFTITGGGARFQLGSTVNSQSQFSLGIQSVSTASLGDSTDGYLASIASGGANSLVSGNTTQAQLIINDAINQVSTLRGRLGAFESDVLNSNSNSLNVALENVTSANSSITDANFAAETANLTRAQVLVSANTSILSTANSQPQSILKLLG
jgi:flagellin